jgi:hypothetical protein
VCTHSRVRMGVVIAVKRRSENFAQEWSSHLQILFKELLLVSLLVVFLAIGANVLIRNKVVSAS